MRATSQDFADARFAVAQEILGSENAGRILQAMNDLTLLYATEADHKRKKGKKAESRRLKHTADEFYTVMMCAIYTRQDQKGE